MAGPAICRSSARQRLRSGFLAGLPEQLRDLGELIESDGTPEARESVAHAFKRLSETAASLGLSGIAREANRLSIRALSAGRLSFAALVKELRSGMGTSPMAPIGIVGSAKTLQRIAGADDGSCEPLVLRPTVEALREAFRVEWPQAIVLPATQAADVVGLAGLFDCPIFLYGAARDLSARRLSVRVGADGYFAEPLLLGEVLGQIRCAVSVSTKPPTVALLGPASWADEQVERLATHGLRAITPGSLEAVAAVLHGIYPDAVVLGPEAEERVREAVQVIRQHLGRSHVAILAWGRTPDMLLAGADDLFGPDDDLGLRVSVRLERMREHPKGVDCLTQLPDRAATLAGVQQAVAQVRRGFGPVTVGVFHLTNLEEIGEEAGREAKNACLRQFAAALQRGLRRIDRVGYLGNHHFLAALVACRPQDAERRFRSIVERFLERAHADRRLRQLSLNVGHASTLRGVQGLVPRAFAALGTGERAP